ncbi:MAG: RnfABCDGE type electron transport complex subunit D [Phycisphaerae bacterium]|jgi:electron transport complex protein RnfD|nr:RnfABCDGE type electron transport complex subunit D [Phycisphaerae bacterium]
MPASEADNMPSIGPTIEAAVVSSAPFYRAPEAVRTIFMVTFAAACGPLLAGVVLFGWRALVVAVISIVSCALIERGYYVVTRTPALLGRSHAYLTGLLLALTLPAFVPWYIPLIAAAFAIIVGKVIFGGVGHFLWQPALVGWLAVAVVFPSVMNPKSGYWSLLAREQMVTGDVTITGPPRELRTWAQTPAPTNAHAFSTRPPWAVLLDLADSEQPAFSALALRDIPELDDRGKNSNTTLNPPDMKRIKPSVIMKMPRINELLYGARAGAIGETCIIVIIVAGLYLVYRHYVKWQLPVAFILSAAVVVAIAPIYLARAGGQVHKVWLPIVSEGFDVGFVYVCYQLLSGELMLAAFFLATEMTCRPTTTGGQILFGICCGILAMCLRMFLKVQFSCFMAVLAMNTFTPTIDALWRPRVLGRKPLLMRLFGRREH